MDQTANPFRFLDLPKDLRLMIYDLLITRNHHKITWTKADETASITLVAPNHIPSIYLACKSVHSEATLFLKAKVNRMNAPRTAARLIVHAGPVSPLFHKDSILDDILWNIKFYCTYDGSDSETNASNFVSDYSDRLKNSTGDVFAVQDFIVGAGDFLQVADGCTYCWYDEAEELLEEVTYNSVDEIVEREKEIYDMMLVMMADPERRAKEIQILLLGSESTEDPGTLDLLNGLAALCDSCNVRAVAYSFGLPDGDVKFRDEEGWLAYAGVVDEKAWLEEWA
ncbi:hypothetical protein CC86DRAFT_413230 [Ophiobolus disseminans]|uniref:F-box domain-containing protein n=1 Tax=Ophiobolus disseminans TaxID=1469910 RepID=A0A6A6ZDT6_9PLEO|nr:hypothetical protein CC86DRAFT_413230 [Ophiobolus disseminans]